MQSCTPWLASLVLASNVHAGPPIQVYEIESANRIFETLGASWFNQGQRRLIDDRGNLCMAVYSQELKEIIILFGEPHRLMRVNALIPLDQSCKVLEYQGPVSAVADETGRIVATAQVCNNGYAELQIQEIRFAGNGHWTTRTLHAIPPGNTTIGNILINNNQEAAWIEYTWDSTKPNPMIGLMMFRDDEVSQIPIPPGMERNTRLERLLDDGTLFVSHLTKGGGETILGAIPTRAGIEWDLGDGLYLDSDFSATSDQAFSDNGGSLFERYFSELTYTPPSHSVTPAFTIDPFVSYPNAHHSISNAGHLLFASLNQPPFRNGLFTGPDTESDALVLEGDILLGREANNFEPLDINSRGEFVFTFEYADPAGSGRSTTGPLLGTICPADMNRDAIFDNGDIAAFVQTYLDGSLRADFTNDGVLDNGDIGEFVSQYLTAVSTGCG